MEESKNLEEVLNILGQISEKENYAIKIPSTEKEETFKDLTAHQQKKILESSLDESIYNKSFNKILNGIILENCSEKKKLEDYTIIDKIVISVSMRQQISDKYKIKLKNGEEIETNLTKIVKDISKKYKHPDKKEVDGEKYKIFLQIPNLETENKYEDSIKDIKQTNVKNVKDIQQIIAGAFIGEISKYITEIEIKNIGNVGYSERPFSEKFKIVENLSAKTIREILDIIKTWKNEIEKYFEVVDSQGNTVSITIDPTFFIN